MNPTLNYMMSLGCFPLTLVYFHYVLLFPLCCIIIINIWNTSSLSKDVTSFLSTLQYTSLSCEGYIQIQREFLCLKSFFSRFKNPNVHPNKYLVTPRVSKDPNVFISALFFFFLASQFVKIHKCCVQMPHECLIFRPAHSVMGQS